ncbi:nitroreductase family deazaflavin-dependent oxidoreductase [Nocardia sp. JMUB6875]|uniref:nitroreductase family deazaflavin-dependent oxidoreductase n=1 Tax=Nocardia sp. JMUB6875 TaxID=3158170 RepID=UPI0032E6E96A
MTDDNIDAVFLLADTDPEAMKAINTELIAEYRATEGNPRGAFEGAPVLLLTTTGARSGVVRTTPVNFTRIGDGYVVLASKSGAVTHPDWYFNLRAKPEATIEIGGQTIAVHARETVGAERTALFAEHAARLPQFAAYQRRTKREIPVVVLEPER